VDKRIFTYHRFLKLLIKAGSLPVKRDMIITIVVVQIRMLVRTSTRLVIQAKINLHLMVQRLLRLLH
jgi:hypothetical protein